jgi:hypothetical protein
VEERLERADVDDATLVVQALEADRRRAAQRQVVGPSVLDDDGAHGRCPGEEPDPARKRHRGTGRRMDRRSDDGHGRFVGERVGAEPLVVDRLPKR